MINSLFSSKEGGTKAFVLNDIMFGWKSVLKMFERMSANEQRVNTNGT